MSKTNGQQGALALRLVRKFFHDEYLGTDDLLAWKHRDSLVPAGKLDSCRDDNPPSPRNIAEAAQLSDLIVAAGRAPGFGSDPIDEKIRVYLDGTHGKGAWQHTRAAYRWEPGGGDEELDRLHRETNEAIARHQAAIAEFWRTRDALRSTNNSQLPYAAVQTIGMAHERAAVAMERTGDEERLARGRETNRAVFLARLAGNWGGIV